jgi:phenylalanyl-tRNA synthetase beta chain
MKVSHSWLQTYFKDTLPTAEKLGELFNAHAFELEGLEKVGNDSVLDLKVLPDRSHYALCHRGTAREASVISKMPLVASVKPEIEVDKGISAVAVTVADSKLCPRYMARRVSGVSVSQSPAWLAERLTAIGGRSINTIVDATNYVMFDIGQPLHAFDADKVEGDIAVRLAHAGEKITVLDGREIELRETDLLITDSVGPLAIAGVKGGKRAEVTTATKNIIIESANFNPTAVRKTSTRANLRNDSSKRFENEITPDLCAEAMNRVTALILELSKGAKAGSVTDIYPKPAQLWTVNVAVSYVSSMVGMQVSLAEIKDILERQGCQVSVSGDMISVTPPLDRLDMIIPEDIGDEIARMKGYGDLVGVQTPDIAQVPIDKTYYWAEKVKSILVTAGFSEALLYALVPKGAFEVAYPLASDKKALRESLEPKLRESLALNTLNASLLGLQYIKEFEIGKTFLKDGEKTMFALGIGLVGKKKGVTAAGVLQEVLERLGNELGVKIVAHSKDPQDFISEIDFDELVSRLPNPGTIADLNFKPLPQDKKYVPFSHYPFITRDIALFVPASVTEGEVSVVISTSLSKTAGVLLVKGPDLFDAFTKDGKTSYAFRMIFQSFEKTLSDDEINVFMTALYVDVKAKGWEVR